MPLRAAVVGVGHLGQYHAEKYATEERSCLAAVVDLDGARAAYIAGKFGAVALSDYRELLGKVDCASVAVPTRSHYTIVRHLLDVGIDVLVEKPLASSAREGSELAELAERKGRILQVGHLERFNPALRAAASVVTSPRFIECHRLAQFVDRGTDIDVVKEIMIHDLDVVLLFVKDEVISLEAVGVPVLTESVDIANARLRFSGGCIANITASRVSQKRERKIRIFEPDAYVAVDFDKRRVKIFRRLVPPGGERPEIVAEERETGRGDPLRDEVRSFIGAVEQRSKPEVDGRDAVKALRLAERIVSDIEHRLS